MELFSRASTWARQNTKPRLARAGALLKLFLDDEFAQLAAEVFHEVQLTLANLVTLHYFDLDDHWGRRWEDLFDAESVADFADNEGLRCASTTGGGDQAFEDLDAFTWLAFGVHVLNLFMETDHHAGFNNRRGDDRYRSVGDFSGFDGVGHRSGRFLKIAKG